MKITETIKLTLQKAQAKREKTAVFHSQVLLNAELLKNLDPHEFCRNVGVTKAYHIEFRKMIAVARTLSELGYSIQKNKMKSIHLIQYDRDPELQPKPIAPGSQTYESGFWSFTIEQANTFKYGNIYFHRKQKSPSFLGGVIKDCWIEQYQGQDRVVFKFESSSSHEGILPKNPDGWDRWMNLEE
jgi:hypothetical protein